MKRALTFSLIMVLGLNTAGMAVVGQAGSYGTLVTNDGLIAGPGLGMAMSANTGLGGGIQHVGPAMQGQGGGAEMSGISAGIGTAAGYHQLAATGGNQMQVGAAFGPVMQMQGQGAEATQTVGKVGGGPGGSAATIAAGSVQGQSFGMGPMSLQQGSGVFIMQSGAVAGSAGASGVTSQTTIVETTQMQGRF